VFELASTNLVIELGIILIVLMGWPFMAAEFAGGILFVASRSAAETSLASPFHELVCFCCGTETALTFSVCQSRDANRPGGWKLVQKSVRHAITCIYTRRSIAALIVMDHFVLCAWWKPRRCIFLVRLVVMKPISRLLKLWQDAQFGKAS